MSGNINVNIPILINLTLIHFNKFWLDRSLKKKVLVLQEEVDRLISRLGQADKEAYLQDKKLRDSKRIQFSSKSKLEVDTAP